MLCCSTAPPVTVLSRCWHVPCRTPHSRYAVQEVDDTHGKMNAALGVMNKMLKSKDRGKFCTIIVLTIVLFVLIFLVFS